jgi:hypothetical protein
MGKRRTYRRCKSCDREPAEAGPISLSGLCESCAVARQLANTAALRARRGPMFEHWYERCREAFEHPRAPLNR